MIVFCFLRSYTGDWREGRQHGNGTVKFKSGTGSKTLELIHQPLYKIINLKDNKDINIKKSFTNQQNIISGETFSGDFEDGAPSGAGQFTYGNGDTELVNMENGIRHGK